MSNFPEPDDFSQLLEKLRTTRGISKKALAHDTQVTPGYISLLTTGERKAPSADKVALLAKALQLNAEERRRFFQAAGYSYSLSLSDAESFYESHLYEAGKSASPLEEDRSGI